MIEKIDDKKKSSSIKKKTPHGTRKPKQLVTLENPHKPH